MRESSWTSYRRAPIVLLALVCALIPSAVSAYDWLQFNGDGRHNGNNIQESAITAANVHSLQRLFQITLPSNADSAPVALQGVSTTTGLRDLVFVTTRAGHLIALDSRSGATVWSKQHGASTCQINDPAPVPSPSNPCHTNASPAIDPNRQFIYAYGLDGYVHKHQVADGAEVMTGGWPELATTKPFNEKGSSALSIAATPGGTYLYASNGGYPGDAGDYQGHVTTIDLATGAQRVFNTLCSNQTVHFAQTPGTPDCAGETQSAVWARSGVVYDSDTGRIYLSTGNGTFNAAQHDWGDSVLALNPDGTGNASGDPVDSYTPATFQHLDDADLDLGSTAPAILPTPPGCAVPHLAVQGGKDGRIRLLNLDNLSGAPVRAGASRRRGARFGRLRTGRDRRGAGINVFRARRLGERGRDVGLHQHDERRGGPETHLPERRSAEPATNLAAHGERELQRVIAAGRGRRALCHCQRRRALRVRPDDRERALGSEYRRHPLGEPARRQWRPLYGGSERASDRLRPPRHRASHPAHRIADGRHGCHDHR